MSPRPSLRSPLLLLLLAGGAVCLFAQGDEAKLRGKILETAAKYRGVPYMYGAQSPSAFDCSGFVRQVYREATGKTLPRSSRDIFAAGTPVDIQDARPGDVFIYDTVGGSPSHVALYLGDGAVIHAVSEGPRTGVIVSPASDPYFSPRLIAARSFLAGAAVSPKRAAETEPAPAPKPAPSLAPKPAPNSATGRAGEEAPTVDIGFTIPRERATYTDRIPAASGTRIAFTLTNGTGRDGDFIVIFYKADPSFSAIREIHREKAGIARGASLALPSYLFSEPGVYKLIVKDTWNSQLLERTFTVRGE